MSEELWLIPDDEQLEACRRRWSEERIVPRMAELLGLAATLEALCRVPLSLPIKAAIVRTLREAQEVISILVLPTELNAYQIQQEFNLPAGALQKGVSKQEYDEYQNRRQHARP